jgi:hypothetical protein
VWASPETSHGPGRVDLRGTLPLRNPERIADLQASPGRGKKHIRRAARPPLVVCNQKRGRRADRVVPPVPATEEITVSESTQDQPDEADEKAPKPGEQDTETVAGQPKKAPASKQQSKQDQ